MRITRNVRRWGLIPSASTGESKVDVNARAACARDTKIAKKDWVVNSQSCECHPRVQETDIGGDQMRLRTGCELPVWKKCVGERGDRLVIEQFRTYRGKERCPSMTNTYSSKQLVGWKDCREIITQSSFDGAKHE